MTTRLGLFSESQLMGVPQHPAARGRAVYSRRPPPNVSAALERQPRGGDVTNHESRDASAARAIDSAVRGPLASERRFCHAADSWSQCEQASGERLARELFLRKRAAHGGDIEDVEIGSAEHAARAA